MKIPLQIDEFRTKLVKSVFDLAKEFDVNIQFKTMRYESDGSGFSCTMSVNNKELNGMPMEQASFEKHCAIYGFQKSEYKAPFQFKNDDFILIGFNPNSPKNNCRVMMVSNEKVYGATDSAVRRAIDKQDGL